MMRFLVCLLLLVTALNSKAEVIKIGLFNGLTLQEIELNVISGQYKAYSDDRFIGLIKTGTKVRITDRGKNIQLIGSDLLISGKTKLELISTSPETLSYITPADSKLRRKVTGHLGFWNGKTKLKVVNTLDLEVYISGVIEAESGSKQNEEYYKVQAVICRTYALANKFKHSKNGFHLCDEVHCQVYKGISESNPDIISATISTSDVVVVDEDVNLITTAFHSNCGGNTINSEHVWSKPVPYLKAVEDTFCLNMPHSKWQKSVKKVNWMGFFKGKAAEDEAQLEYTDNVRITYTPSGIHYKEIRKEFNLNSTLFQIEEKDSEVIISGRGFGHGVGLCQEGAMSMSQQGYDYISILHHYFTDIHVVPLSRFHLFQEN